MRPALLLVLSFIKIYFYFIYSYLFYICLLHIFLKLYLVFPKSCLVELVLVNIAKCDVHLACIYKVRITADVVYPSQENDQRLFSGGGGLLTLLENLKKTYAQET